MVETAEPPCSAPQWVPRRLRVPRTDRSVLAVPPLPEIVPAALENHRQLARGDVDVQGRSLAVLRDWSRRACLDAARRYTAELTGQEIDGPGVRENGGAEISPLFVAGHQPALFHPGVWVKNFAIDRFARLSGGAGLNLVVDNDTLSSTSIRVPHGTREAPGVERVAFDSSRPVGPWEDAAVLDRELFESFGDRLREAMADWGIRPLAADIWPDAVAHLSRSPRLCDALTAARHRQERRWGLGNLELPISRLCQCDPFLWFASHIFAQLPRFRECHNRVLAEYRCVNRVRSRNHPVPELGAEDGWHEAPFWVWRSGETNRGRVFARQAGSEVHLSDGSEIFCRLRLKPDGEACCAVEALRELPAQGIRLRTRALTTTLFARLCLGDLFVHGIGGAKYDEMTDQIIGRFFGLQPPRFLTLTATLHLPLAEPHPVTVEDQRRLEHLLRDLTFNADRHEPGPQAEALTARKRALIADQQAVRTDGLTQRERRERRPVNQARYEQLEDVRRQLAELAAPQRQAVAEELEDVRRQLVANRVLTDREFPFALYPPDVIREFLRGAVSFEHLSDGPGDSPQRRGDAERS